MQLLKPLKKKHGNGTPLVSNVSFIIPNPKLPKLQAEAYLKVEGTYFDPSVWLLFIRPDVASRHHGGIKYLHFSKLNRLNEIPVSHLSIFLLLSFEGNLFIHF